MTAAAVALLAAVGLLAVGGVAATRSAGLPRSTKRGLGHGPYVTLSIAEAEAAGSIRQTLEETAHHLRQLQENPQREAWDELLEKAPSLESTQRLEHYAQAASHMARVLKEFDPGVDPTDLFGF
jgi:hypothetical protein